MSLFFSILLWILAKPTIPESKRLFTLKINYSQYVIRFSSAKSPSQKVEYPKGRKRHIVVDVMGNLLSVVVHAANIHDTKAGMLAAQPPCDRYRSLKSFCADAGYRGTFVRELGERFGLDVDISEKIKPHEWEKLPWRWVVERTFVWLNHSRRLSKDYEISTASAAAMVTHSHLHTPLKRILLRQLYNGLKR